MYMCGLSANTQKFCRATTCNLTGIIVHVHVHDLCSFMLLQLNDFSCSFTVYCTSTYMYYTVIMLMLQRIGLVSTVNTVLRAKAATGISAPTIRQSIHIGSDQRQCVEPFTIFDRFDIRGDTTSDFLCMCCRIFRSIRCTLHTQNSPQNSPGMRLIHVLAFVECDW